jgi:O-antigen ligase
MQPLKKLEKMLPLPKFRFLFLCLMILALPSIEAPKNLFLVLFLIIAAILEISFYRSKSFLWGEWDNIFLLIVFTAALSSFYAGMPHLEEWKGFRVLLTAILTGWLLSRTQISKARSISIFLIIILATLPPLLWGLYELFILHSKSTLELHSVGHVNHSAIYLVMIYGATLTLCLDSFNQQKKVAVLNNYEQPLLILLSLLFFTSLIIGQSRGAFGISIILTLILIFFIPENKKIKWWGLFCLFSILSFNLIYKTTIVEKQISNQENHNILSSRDKVWNVSMEAARFNPILGIGMSNWHFISLNQLKSSVEKRHKTFNPDEYYFPGHSHNLYLTALVERGIVGLIVTLIFMLYWLKHLISTFSWAKKTKSMLLFWGGSFSAWLATFGIGTVNTTFHHEHAILASIFLGLYINLTNNYYKKISSK